MDWMAERADQRARPDQPVAGRAQHRDARHELPARRTIPSALLARTERGAIAAYAQRRDYHEVVKGKLKELGGYLSAKGDVRVKVFVDTAPVMEKPLAAAAGLGWQGKHTVLVSRDHGNWLLLGAIYTRAELEPDDAGRRPLRLLPAPASTSARPTPSRRPTGSMRGAASPT